MINVKLLTGVLGNNNNRSKLMDKEYSDLTYRYSAYFAIDVKFEACVFPSF